MKGNYMLRVGVSAAALAITSAGHAQTMPAVPPAAQEAEPAGLEEIVVTAQKRSENLQNVPIAITAVTADAMASRGITTASEISNFAPNVQLDASAPIFASSQILTGFIRGIGQNDISSSLEPGVGIYVDGVIVARSIGANIDLLDIDRVEVLKGPQGTLFGRNTIGGAISVVTRDPSHDFGVRGEATYGSRNRFELRGTVDIPLTDTIRSQLSFSTKTQDGYQKIIPFAGDFGVTDQDLLYAKRGERGRRGNVDNYSFRGKLLWEASPDLTIKVSGDYGKADEQSAPITLVKTDTNPLAPAPTYAAVYNSCISAPGFLFDTGGPLAFLAAICGPRGGGLPGAAPLPGLAGYNPANPNAPRLLFGDQFITNDIDRTYGNGSNYSVVETYSATGTIDLRVSDALSIKSITGYRHVQAHLGNDLDGSPVLIGDTTAALREKQFSQELQFNLKGFDDRLKSVAGLYYFYEDNKNLETAFLSEGLGQFYGPANNTNRSYAVYTNNSISLTDKLGLTLGARYTIDRKRFSAGQSDLNLSLLKLGLFTPDQLPDPNDPSRIYPLGEFKDTYKNFSYRIGADYHVTSRILAYASYANAFKSGGYTTRLSIPTPGNVAPRFSPEKAGTYEVGLKTELFDRKLQINAAAFHTDYSNLQITVVRGISPFIQNAGKAKIDGFEIEAQARPIPEVRLSGSVGYVDARYTQLDPGVTVTLADKFVNTPDWTASASADVDLFQLGGGQITAHADYSYKSSIARDAVNTPLLIAGSTHIVGATIGWMSADEKFQLVGGVKNLTDERYIVSGTQVDAIGATSVNYSRPREYYLTFRIRN